MISNQLFNLKKDGTPYSNCYCITPEIIENYDKAIVDTTQTLDCHHRLETHTSDGERRLVDISRTELIALGVYYDRPPEELIFLTQSEHQHLHNVGKPSNNKGMHHSEETKRRISESNSGKHHIGYNKGKQPSEETRRKLSESHKGKVLSEEQKQKISEKLKGRKKPMRSDEHRKKQSEAIKGKHWKLVDGKRVWY